MPLDAGAPQKTYRWDDPLDLSSRLSEEERMVWDAARAYAREKLLPRVVSAYAEERFDREIMTEMGELGFLGPTLPEEYGCAGVNHVAYGLIAREIEAVILERFDTTAVEAKQTLDELLNDLREIKAVL